LNVIFKYKGFELFSRSTDSKELLVNESHFKLSSQWCHLTDIQGTGYRQQA